MAEAFELSDEPSGLAFGVSFAEVVAAEVSVQLAVLNGRLPSGRDCRWVSIGLRQRFADHAIMRPLSVNVV